MVFELSCVLLFKLYCVFSSFLLFLQYDFSAKGKIIAATLVHHTKAEMSWETILAKLYCKQYPEPPYYFILRSRKLCILVIMGWGEIRL